MGRPLKTKPNKSTTPDLAKLEKRKARTRARARRRGTVAQITWDSGAQPAPTGHATFSAK